MLLLPPRSKPSATLVPVTTLFRSKREQPPIGEIFGISRGVEGRRVRRTVAGGGGKREEQDRSGAPQAAERIRFAQRRRGAEAEETRDGAQTGWQRWPTTGPLRSEEHTSELQSLMRISYAVFCLKKKTIVCSY